MICDDYDAGQIDFSKWRKLDSRNFGISRSMIPPSAWVVLKILQSEGDTFCCIQSFLCMLLICLPEHVFPELCDFKLVSLKDVCFTNDKFESKLE